LIDLSDLFSGEDSHDDIKDNDNSEFGILQSFDPLTAVQLFLCQEQEQVNPGCTY
jgi:hypothetical protein